MLKNSEYIALLPNVMIGLQDHFYVFWLEPLLKKLKHMQMYYYLKGNG